MKLEMFHLRTVPAGLRNAWQERGYDITAIVAGKVINNILKKDSKLLIRHDQAVTRIGGNNGTN